MKNVETKQLPTKMYYEDSAWSRDWSKWWHESCDKLGLPYDVSFKDFTLAIGKRIIGFGFIVELERFIQFWRWNKLLNCILHEIVFIVVEYIHDYRFFLLDLL